MNRKLPVTGTNHILPFEKLSPADFERLCLWLVTEEGYNRAEHYGVAGNEQGRDIVAHKRVGASEELWYFQCKRVKTVSARVLMVEVDKVLALKESRPELEPRGLVFVITTFLRGPTRDVVRKYAAEMGLACEFWGLTELDQRTKKYRQIAAEFFQLDIAGFAQDAEHKLTEAQERFYETDYAAAIELSEEAARLASKANNIQVEKRARFTAATAWDSHIVRSPLGDRERAEALSRMERQVDALGHLNPDPGDLELQRARLAIFNLDPTNALAWAEKSLGLAKEGSVTWVDALLTCIQAQWQSDNVEKALEMAALVRRACAPEVEGHARLAVATTWLRTLGRAAKATGTDIDTFIELVRDVVSGSAVSFKQAMISVGEVAQDFNRSNSTSETLKLLEFAYELGEQVGQPAMPSSAALQIAEVAAHAGNVSKATEFLGKAYIWVEKANSGCSEANSLWAGLWANWLSTKGRILVILAEQFPSSLESVEDTLHEAYDVLDKARQFVLDNRFAMRGDVELFVADLQWWSGLAASNLNWSDTAIERFRAVRSEPAMANPGFAAHVGMRSWLHEAEALSLAGRFKETSQVLDGLLASPMAEDSIREQAERLKRYQENAIRPVVEWFGSTEAQAVAELTREKGLRQAVAQQVSVLTAWWTQWHGVGGSSKPRPLPKRLRNDADGGLESVIMDFWGRGAFSRLAAAIRAKPHAAIAVDARTIEEIGQWARILCQLYDTVVVKWKGQLGEGMVLLPIHESLGERAGSFGGHGYAVMAGDQIGNRKDWTIAMGWANPLPAKVCAFLSHEAITLVASGRLVVVPAPLAGCTQSAVGWTDNVLVDGFLGGVVNVARRQSEALSGQQRILDLSEITIPYMANIGLGDLAEVLEETEEWVPHLRSLLFESIHSKDLRRENFAKMGAIENEIRAASNELQANLKELSKRHDWVVLRADGNLSAAAAGENLFGREPVSNLLRSVASSQRDLAPWIPYWRMNSLGGRLDWSCPIDNPTKPPPERSQPKELHSWLHPGTAGWTIPTFVVPSGG